MHRRRPSRDKGRRGSKGRSSSKEAGASAAKSKEEYIDEVVKPTLEQLTVMVFAENPMPLEDPVSFLIEKLVATHKLKPPEAGSVDQKEVGKLRETTTWLRGKMAQIDVVEERVASFDDTSGDPDPNASVASSPEKKPEEGEGAAGDTAVTDSAVADQSSPEAAPAGEAAAPPTPEQDSSG